MYKQLGSCPSVNTYGQTHNEGENNDRSREKSLNTSNSNLETRAQASTRSQVSNSRPITTPIQDEPLELTVQKATSSDKSKSVKKQPKTAAILQQKKLHQSKKQAAKPVSPATPKKNAKCKATPKSKSPLKKQKEKAVASNDIMDTRRPRRGAAIAASAAMMAQKSVNVAFSDDSSSDEDGAPDNETEKSTVDTNETEGKF